MPVGATLVSDGRGWPLRMPGVATVASRQCASLGNVIPLAPGTGNLEPMSWAWLNSPVVLLLGFIATLATIWAAIIWPIARRASARPAGAPAVAPPGPSAQPAPTVFMASVGNTGGAVSTFGVSIASAPVIPITDPPNTINPMRLYKDYMDDRDYKESLSWSAEGPTRPGVPVYPG
jgi:hypothetical protein